MQEKHKTPPSAGFSVNLGDIYHMLFRHKWKIMAIWCLGLAAAGVVYVRWPIQFNSEAVIFVRYVKDNHDVAIASQTDQNIASTSSGADSVVRTEMEVLQSLDVAKEAADALPPELVLRLCGFTNTYDAAAVIRNGIQITTEYKTPVMHVVFKHPNPDLVQPVLTQLIQSYFEAHKKVHQLTGPLLDETLSMQTETFQHDLEQTQAELRELKNTNGVDELIVTKKLNAELMAKIKEDLWSAQTELEEHQAILSAYTTHLPTNTAVAKIDTNQPVALAPPSPEKIGEYNELCAVLKHLQDRKRELRQEYTEESPRVQTYQAQIDHNLKLKTDLERQYPQLTAQTTALQPTVITPTGRVITSELDLPKERSQVLALQTKIKRLQQHQIEIQIQIDRISTVESRIRELERKRDDLEANLSTFKRKLFDEKMEGEMNNGTLSNLKFIQKASPASSDTAKRNKVVGVIALAGVVLGLALAFVLEFYFDRSIKRPIEIETKLGLPLFLSIPETRRNGRHRLGNGKVRLLAAGDSATGPRSAEPAASEPLQEIRAWKSDPAMQPFFEAFRDRLITHFEINEINHKPKLVAVTSCNSGSGVSTVASGLAASLSETGDGNVLLVDMNTEGGAAHFFHQGKQVCGLDEVLEKNTNRINAQVEPNLFVVTESPGDENLPRILHKRFSALIPKIHASDYDYIIFDMPPVSQTSATTRVARFMDMVFMVVEAEKTDLDTIKRASKMLTDAKATSVGVVLNKSHNYVPGRLNQEL